MAKAKRRGNEGGEPRGSPAKLKRNIGEIGILPGWDDEDDQAALVMLAPLSIGTRDVGAVSRFTGVALTRVREFYGRIEENGMLPPGGMVVAAWADAKDGKHLFLMDVWV